MSKQIQWFPGHMSKTLNEFKKIKADLYFLLLDSRAPESTFIDTLKEIIENKKVIIFLTKIDLVKKEDLKKFINNLKKKYKNIFLFSTNSFFKKNDIKIKILNILNSMKFKSVIPKIVILGVPNVGKSTLLNIFTNKKSSPSQNKPGVTKKSKWYQFEKKYWILDTPGVLQPKFVSKDQGINLALIGSIKLDILPLDEVTVGLIQKLINLNIIDCNNSEIYLNQLIKNSSKSPDVVFKNIIKSFQDLKYGKVILD